MWFSNKKKLSVPVGEQEFPLAMELLSKDANEFLTGEFVKKVEFFRDSRNALLEQGVEPDGSGFRQLYALGLALYSFNAGNALINEGYIQPAKAREFAGDFIAFVCMGKKGNEFAGPIFETGDTLEAERVFALAATKLILGKTPLEDSLAGYLCLVILIESRWLSMTACLRVAQLFDHAANVKVLRDERLEWERSHRHQAYENLKAKSEADLAAMGSLIAQR